MRVRVALRRWRSGWPVALAAAVYLGLGGTYLVAAGGNFTFFVHLAANHPVAEAFGGPAAGLWVGTATHDGASYYAIARQPFAFALQRRIFITPAIWYRRLAYPLLVYLFSAGQPALVAPMMLAVNLLAILAGGALLISWLARQGLSVAWSLGYLLHPGVVLSFLYDLPTAPAVLAALLGLLAYERGSQGWAAFSLTLAMLTWEVVALPVVAGLLGHALLRRRRDGAGPFPWALTLPVVVAFGWGVVVQQVLRDPYPAAALLANVGSPLGGWWQAAWYLVGQPLTAQTAFTALFLASLALGMGAVGHRFLQRPDVWASGGLAAAVVLVSLTARNLVWPIEFTRKSLPLWLMLLFGFAADRHGWSRWALMAAAAASPLAVAWLPPLPG